MRMIVGVDPGTTVGYAVLDLTGSVVEVSSKKELSIDSLVSRLVKLGRVLVVGTDKAKVPSFVDELGRKLRARVIHPPVDVRVSEKRKLAGFYSCQNSHEMDALAAALLAFRKVEGLLKRVRNSVAREGMPGLFEDVADIVVRGNKSIDAALVALTAKTVPKKRESAPVVLKRSDSEVALSRAKKEVSVLRKNLAVLRDKLERSNTRLGVLKSRNAGLVKPKSNDVREKELKKQIYMLRKKLQLEKLAKARAESKLEEFQQLIFTGLVPLQRIPHFGNSEVRRILPFLGGGVIVVDNPNEYSKRSASELKKSIGLVLFRREPSRKVRMLLPFGFHSSKGIVKKWFDNIAFADAEALDKARSSESVLRKLVVEYKRSRFS